ncbi:MAG: fumarylacetoacetate hydrolase family protein [Rubrivivax sp.]
MQTLPQPQFNAAPWRLSGRVLGVALNDPAALAALGDAVHAPPYKAPPRTPVLYVKPRNTLVANGSTLAQELTGVELGATLGLVIGQASSAVPVAQALQHVAGCLLVADLSLPHDSWYRPAVRAKARDGSCVLGPLVAPVDPASTVLEVCVDGEPVQRVALAQMQRGAAQLLAEVSEFMTLQPGDLLLLGLAASAPRLRAGQSFSITAPGLGRLQGSLA